VRRARGCRPRTDRLCATVTVACAVAVLALLVPPGVGPAGAQDEPPSTTSTTSAAPESPGIIPEPGSGSEPEDAGDRGGTLQTVLFALIVMAVLAIGAMVVRESRRARRRRGF
jgi:hypothetical protein